MANAQEFPYERKALGAVWRAANVPIENGGTKSFLGQRIRNPFAELSIGRFKLRAPSIANGFGKRAMKIAEEGEGTGRASLLAHEHERRHRGKQRHRERGGERRFVCERGDAIAQRPVPDLIMVLQEVHKRQW